MTHDAHDAAVEAPLVGVIMGSKSDWETMRHAAELLREFAVAYECRVVSAHRTPRLLIEYAQAAEGRGLALRPWVYSLSLGVPVQTAALGGMDSLLSIVQMPRGVPVGTLAIGAAGAANAALLAIRILAVTRPELRERLRGYAARRADEVMRETLT